ncbi:MULTISPECIES: diacylglycerol kinase [Nonlabens]|uniref:diacylglycerol kinase n=1 Tax=Nonlabens TaxID=363408 RepID=UPI000CF4B602|nr:diacylglycerol kinase family protein [Nonlabens tegetincola]PQJ18543.1 diacylglycerol kinase [Nonlabens tegetincola]
MNLKQFIIGRIKGVGYAFKGAFALILSEPSIQVQAIIGVVMTIAGFVFNITRLEWMIQCMCIGGIMSLEGLNTAIEGIADFIHPEFHEKIGRIKDIAAGAVFITAITASIVGLIIYIPYIVELFS